MATPRVLIVEDGLGPHPLAAARSFGSAGWRVGIGSPKPGGRAGSSRWVTGWHPVPPAEDDVLAFLAATRTAIAAGGYDIVFGGDDIEVLALSAARATLGALLPYPAHHVALHLVDKLELTLAASRAGLAVPRTLPPAAMTNGAQEMPFPVVVKARLHWTPGRSGVPARLDRAVCRTPAEVGTAVARIAAAGGSAIVQELVEGRLMALTLLVDRTGRPIATVQQEARRVSPYWHNSVRAETVGADQDLVDRSTRMLADLGWWGLANLQFLVPAGGGAPRLIDFNGRFYGSLALARAAGADLPVLWARLALDLAVPAPVSARVGIRYQSLEEDLRRAMVERRDGLRRDLWETLRYAHGAVHSTWSGGDRGPAMWRTRELVNSELRRVAGAVLKRGGAPAG